MTSDTMTNTNSQPASLDPLLVLTKQAMARTNDVIIERLGSDVPLIPQLAGHLVAAGGKRMRPMLCLAGALLGQHSSGGAPGSDLPEAAHLLAASVEFIHSATLLHDDVIDMSDKRRGRDTANAIWGNEASVLVGDFLFARAFQLMVLTGDISVLDLLSSASARITEGEIKQMSLAGEPASPLEDYLDVITNKTAILFAAAAESGCRVGGGTDAECLAMHNYGLSLGRAFQICDDALDYAATSDGMGKNTGDDFRDGKITMPVILAWGDGSAQERAFWQRTQAESDINEGDFEEAVAILNRHNAIERSLAAAGQEVELALKSLSGLGDTALTSALISAALFSVKRSH